MTDTKIQEKLKPGLKLADFQKDGDIYLALNSDYVSGDNAKYMTMYNRLARWYDFGEKWIGPLLHGKAIDKLRMEGSSIRPLCLYRDGSRPALHS